jgi:hypothetical protein
MLLGFALLLQHFTSQAQLLQGIAYVRQDEAPSLKRIIAITKSTNEKVIALIRLGSLYFHDPYPHVANLHSAMQLANEASQISSRAGLTKFYNDAQFLIANIYLRKYWPDSAAKVLVRVNDSTRLKILLAMSHIYRIIQSEDSKARLKKAMDLTLEAQDISRKIHDTLLSILVQREIACIHSDTQQPNSEKELLYVIKLMQGIGYPYLHYTYYELGGTAMLEGNEDKVLYYGELTLNSMRQSGDSLGAPDWLLSHAMILRITGQHEKSLSFLDEEVAAGRFRMDLYYRLNVFPIVVPPLRERKEDILLLANSFISKFADMERKIISGFSVEVVREMESYEWPGNVRELENLMQRTALLTKGLIVTEFYHKAEALKLGYPDEKLKSIIENERDHIISTLKKCNWKVYGPGGAAELLDINVSTLNSRIKKLGIKKSKLT